MLAQKIGVFLTYGEAVVAGLGYVGLPLAMRAVAAGHEVTGYDTDPVRVKRLEAGESYVEDVPPGELAAALESVRFHPSARADACAAFEVAVITVPEPLRESLPDLTRVEAATRTLARHPIQYRVPLYRYLAANRVDA